MPDMKANTTFACEWGLFHEDHELPADHPAVKAFPQFFTPVEEPPRRGRPPGKASGDGSRG